MLENDDEKVTTRVADLSVRYPDENLVLRDEFQEELRASIEYVQAGGKTLSAEDVAIRLQFKHENLFHVLDQIQQKLPDVSGNEVLQDVAEAVVAGRNSNQRK